MTLDTFTQSYLEAALWSSVDDSGLPLDATFTVDDLAKETVQKASADCAEFQAWVEEYHPEVLCNLADERKAGHDFWLTRNGHGAGFWDGDWPDPFASGATAESKRHGEIGLLVGDDGVIY